MVEIHWDAVGIDEADMERSEIEGTRERDLVGEEGVGVGGWRVVRDDLCQCLEAGGLRLLFDGVIVIHLEEKGGWRVGAGGGFRGDGGGLIRLGVDDVERFQVAEMMPETKV